MRTFLYMANKRKIINDPVFGFLSIPNDLIYDVLQHPYVQRLNRIRQLGLSYLVYPGAMHSRFGHSLGAMHLMQEAIQSLRLKGESRQGECLAMASARLGSIQRGTSFVFLQDTAALENRQPHIRQRLRRFCDLHRAVADCAEKGIEITFHPGKEDEEKLLPVGYGEILKLGENAEYYYIFPSATGGYCVPKKALGEREQEFVRLLEDKTGKKFYRRRPSPMQRIRDWLRQRNSEPYHL